MTPVSVLWRRLDLPGHEAGRLDRRGDGWSLSGTAAFAHEGQPVLLAYDVACGRDWQTRSVDVSGYVGRRGVEIAITVDSERRWRLNGERCPPVDGCVDVDLGFSPSTNLLPIRRHALRVGASAEVRAAWLPFPGLALEPLAQVYHREGDAAYRYESRGGAFVRVLDVDPSGFVTDYPGLWRAEALV